jgi:hypothetical protein
MKGACALRVRTSIGLYWVAVDGLLVLGTVGLQLETTEAPVEGATEGSDIDLKVLVSCFGTYVRL